MTHTIVARRRPLSAVELKQALLIAAEQAGEMLPHEATRLDAVLRHVGWHPYVTDDVLAPCVLCHELHGHAMGCAAAMFEDGGGQ